MSDTRPTVDSGRRRRRASRTPARSHELRGGGIQGYLIGLALAVLLTAASFCVVHTDLIWGPAIPVALIVLAIAQIGVHLVFFLHITTAPDNTNNVLALAFGVLIVALVIVRLALDHEPPEPQHDADGRDDAAACGRGEDVTAGSKRGRARPPCRTSEPDSSGWIADL